MRALANKARLLANFCTDGEVSRCLHESADALDKQCQITREELAQAINDYAESFSEWNKMPDALSFQKKHEAEGTLCCLMDEIDFKEVK